MNSWTAPPSNPYNDLIVAMESVQGDLIARTARDGVYDVTSLPRS